MKLRVLAISAVLVTVLFAGVAAQSFAQEESLIPKWIKGVAGWWSNNKISDTEFLQAVDYLVNTGAIKPKIVQEQQAKIAELEAQIEELKNPPVEQNDDPLADLKSSTIDWVNGDIADDDYYSYLQQWVDAGWIGPFDFDQGDLVGNVFGEPINDIEQVKDMLGKWAMGENSYDNAFYYFGYLYASGLIHNPTDYVQPEPEISDSAKEQLQRQETEKAYMQNQLDIIKNGQNWIDGKISDKQYLYNIMDMYNDGKLKRFGQYGDYDVQGEPTADSIAKLLQDKENMSYLKSVNKRMVEKGDVTESVIALHDIFSDLRE